jgi:TolB-like protein/DNA-binding winged helix-turn-helix (wHTH) protein/Tfp pilus assembly protein PilF
MPNATGFMRQARFGPFEVDFRAGELHKNGRKIRLQDQPLQVLALLLEQPGEVVTREELQQKLWPMDTFVDFDHGLNNAINKLRDALNDSAEAPRFIETLPRRGYRFAAGVDKQESAALPAHFVNHSQSNESLEAVPVKTADEVVVPVLRPYWFRRFRLAVAGLGLLVVLFVGLRFLLHQRPLATGVPAHIRSIAVLPLENLSGDPAQEYFADGITDELTTDLAQIGSLRIVSRTSAMNYKGKREPLPQVAKELRVDAVVEGSVERHGDQVRVRTQLIDASTDTHIWAETFDRDTRDVLTLEGEIARKIALAVRANLTQEEESRVARVRHIDPDLFDLYLRGRSLGNERSRESLEKSLSFYQEISKRDPDFALAHAGAADSYILLGDYSYVTPEKAFPKAEVEAEKALQLDSSLAEAHTSLAMVKSIYDRDWLGADAEYRRALTLNPSYARGHHWYARYLTKMARHQDALAEINRAVDCDPLDPFVEANVGEVYYFGRQFDQAIQVERKALATNNDLGRTHADLGRAYLAKGQYGESIAELRRAISIYDTNIGRAILGNAYAVAGKRQDAQAMLDTIEKYSEHDYVAPYFLAIIYAGLGQKDQAFGYLEAAYGTHDGWLGFLKVDPALDPLRSDPRFQDLLRRMNFPSSPPSA